MDQGGHLLVAGGAGTSAKHDGDDAAEDRPGRAKRRSPEKIGREFKAKVRRAAGLARWC